ncbi:MAG: peptidoglycan-binding protein, partial [Leptospirales bacterium]|nr:peptidoglycan-binding protein [Leptospirales bacterium]
TSPIDRSVINPRWDKAKATIGEKVLLKVELRNQYENATVEYKIFPEGADTKKDQPIQKLYERNEGGKSETEWGSCFPADYKIDTMEDDEIPSVNEIAGIQYRLKKLGYECGDINGKRNIYTRNAVKKFQEANGLSVDGIPGEKTQKKLDEMYKKKEKTEKKEQEGVKYIFTAESFGCEQVKAEAITIAPAFLEIKLEDEGGRVFAGEYYELELPDGIIYKGELNGDGYKKIYIDKNSNAVLTFPNLDKDMWER